MRNININIYFLFILLLTIDIIHSTPKENNEIKVDEILGIQKCFDFNKINAKDDNKTMVIYEINNNSTKNTVFIQYNSVKQIAISDSFKDESSILYTSLESSGSYYLNMKFEKQKYYIALESDSKPYKICFIAFPQKANIFTPIEKNKNIKLASYELLSSNKLAYYIDNNDLSQNKIFYGIRFEKKYLDKIENPKIQINITFTNSERKNEVFEIHQWYLQNNYLYAPFFVPTIKYYEKFTDIILCLNIKLKNELSNDELFKFDLELIESEEITNEFNLNITSNKQDCIISPKIYFVNIKKNIYEFDRDILFLKNDIKNNYINPFFTSNFNASNENSVIVDKSFIDISKSFLQLEKYSKLPNIDLFIIILDEECNNIGENDNIFISFKFFGGYHSLIHYQENISQEKLFNGEKNKMMIKMDHCRTQYFINYFQTDNKNDERILDIESAIGDMNLYHSNEIKGTSLDDYFKHINKLCIHNFNNSISSGNYNTYITSCPTLDPVLSYIYAHRKNSIEDTISFINQKSLIYIEYNNQYSLQFNSEEKNNQFEFRIRVLRTNIKENYKIDITYGSEAFSLENEKDVQIFKHVKNTDTNLKIKISSSAGNNDAENKGFILEIFKSIDISEKDIIFYEKEVEKDKLEMDKMVLFSFDKNEINSAKSIIEFYNDNQASRNINICVHRGKGKYPFIIKPICSDEQENIIIKPKENLTLTYNNPYNSQNVDDENNIFYVSILTDRSISFSYKYEREIYLDENKYIDLNHKGNKIFKLSNKINQKKSIYYQINLCGNKNKNSTLYYSINKSNSVPITNDIYQEFSFDSIKSYSFEFNSQNGNQNAKFKYFYSKSNLIKTIENFSREIFLLKNSDNDKLLIKFEIPFTEMVNIKIILIKNSQEKYYDFCQLMKFYENCIKDENIKIIEQKVRTRENMENKVEVSIDRKDITDFMNKNVDIYVIAQGAESMLEIVYDVKTEVINWGQLSKDDSSLNKKNDNLICINCGLNGELKQDRQINNERNIVNENNERININNKFYNNQNNENQSNQRNNNLINLPGNQINNLYNNNNQNNNENNNNINNYNNTKSDNDNRGNNNENNNYNNNQNINNNQSINNNLFNQRNDNIINIKNRDNITQFNNIDKDINGTNITKENNLLNTRNNTLLNKEKNKKEELVKNNKPKKKKSRKLLYFTLIVIIIALYYCWNKYNNENVSYSKISKYSYYDF